MREPNKPVWLAVFMAILTLVVVACGRVEMPTVVAPAAEPAFSPTAVPDSSLPEDLPAPVVVTVQAGAPEQSFGPVGSQDQAVIVNAAGAGDDLPPELNQLLLSIEGGGFTADKTVELAAGGQPTIVYGDVNGDGVEDEIIILIVSQEQFDEFNDALSQGGAPPSLIPLPAGEDAVVKAIDVGPGQILAEVVSVNPDQVPYSRQLIFALTGEGTVP